MFNPILLSAAAMLALINSINALPTTEIVYPELIPGPGLPSLASLNLTSKDLYTMTPAISLEARSALFNGVCQTFSTANVDDAIACFNYLNSIGGNSCGTDQSNVIMCTIGTAQISGANLVPGTSSTASCANCAVGVQWIFTNCNSGGQVGGQAPAYGNGNLIMGVQNISWNGKKAKKN